MSRPAVKKVLAPHNDQDGWVYWRVRATTGAANAPAVNPLWLVKKDTLECVKASDIGVAVGYRDVTPTSRIIASRRVERAVELDDFLKLCAEEGLAAQMYNGCWLVWQFGSPLDRPDGRGKTLREAYYRYHAGVGR